MKAVISHYVRCCSIAGNEGCLGSQPDGHRRIGLTLHVRYGIMAPVVDPAWPVGRPVPEGKPGLGGSHRGEGGWGAGGLLA